MHSHTPSKYIIKVKAKLRKRKISFSTSYVSMVYHKKRRNTDIELAIAEVENEEKIKKDVIKKLNN